MWHPLFRHFLFPCLFPAETGSLWCLSVVRGRVSVFSEPSTSISALIALPPLSANLCHIRTTSTGTIQALLVGALGERYIAGVDGPWLGFHHSDNLCSMLVLSPAIATFFAFSVALLSSEAAQAMAGWMFDGTDYRSVAAICLVLCVSTPLALFAWRLHVKATIMRLIDQCPPATDGQS